MYTPEEACQLAEAAILLSGGQPLPVWAKELNLQVAQGKITGDQACEEIKRRLGMPNMQSKEDREREEQLKEMNATAFQVNEIRKQEARENGES